MQAARTLVKSPPELWAELSDADSLARHLGEFGEIRIVRTEPESVVEWEGDRASGSVRLEPAGWGTRVTLTAEELAAEAVADEAVVDEAVAAESPAAEPSPPPTPDPPAADPSPPPISEPPPRTRRGFFARLFRRRPRPAPAEDELCRVGQPDADKVDTARREEAAPVEEPPAKEAPVEEPPAKEARGEEPPAEDAPADEPRVDAAAVLDHALDALGAAHHRPFSR